MKRLSISVFVPLLVFAAVALGCSSDSPASNDTPLRASPPAGRADRPFGPQDAAVTPTKTAEAPSEGAVQGGDFALPAGPTLQDVEVSNAPSYLFLFTHTEDQFNHELSEERYWRVGQMIEDIAAAYPDLDITWTIEFQGSDAETVRERNPETGLVDYLLSLKDKGLVEFGYHAYHDPTYANRPQNDLPPEPSYDEAYDALWTWITCRKDPVRGGCIEERGGGLEAILDTFGQVKIVTGLGVSAGAQVERSAGSQAVRALVPDRLLSFGFPDHGGLERDRDFLAARDGLLSLLTPTNETSSGTFWMDNSISINDSASLEDVNLSPLRDGPDELRSVLESLDGSRSFVLNTGIADKYLYTVESTSPTKWAYSNPDSPELPPQYLQPVSEREKRYTQTQQSLEYLAQAMSSDPDALRFVSADQVVDLFTSEDYWEVDEAELEQIALWLLNHWDSQPPAWTYDGEDFYSLADAFGLLVDAMQDAGGQGRIVSNVYGPWSAVQDETGATSVSVADLRDLLGRELIQEGRIAESYRVGSQTLSATQTLYALSYLYVLDRNGVEATTIDVPAMATAPETLGYLETLGCSGCLDTAWSLKPARFQNLSD
jgi:hypothetical protein